MPSSQNPEKSNPPLPGSSLLPFVALWILWALLLGGAMIVGNLDRHGSALATAGRMGSSIVLVVTAAFAYWRWQHTALRRFLWLIALGMALGTLGDFFNAGLLEFVPVLHGVLGGIVAFGLGHIAYIVGCVELDRRIGLLNRQAVPIAILIWQVIGVVAWYFVAYQGTEARDVLWPALPYTMLLSGTAGITSGLAWLRPRLIPLALGGALFLLSDLILAVGMFRGHFDGQTEWVWLTYGPGQMFIVFSTLIPLQFLGNRTK